MCCDLTSSPRHIFWFFGLPSAGKSTLAVRLGDYLRLQGIPVLSLDGDVLRAGLSQGLGFSESDRSENIRRAASVACIGVESSLTVVAAFITPLESHRELVAKLVPSGHLSLIHVDAPIEVCRARDVKGLYARAQSGHVNWMTGSTSSAFEAPERADLVISTSRENIEESANRVIDFARQKLMARAG